MPKKKKEEIFMEENSTILLIESIFLIWLMRTEVGKESQPRKIVHIILGIKSLGYIKILKFPVAEVRHPGSKQFT